MSHSYVVKKRLRLSIYYFRRGYLIHRKVVKFSREMIRVGSGDFGAGVIFFELLFLYFFFFCCFLLIFITLTYILIWITLL